MLYSRPMFTVDDIISKRYPAILHKPLLNKWVSGVLKYLTHEDEFLRFERETPHIKGFDFVDKVLEYFDFSYAISNRDRERIPSSGRVVIISNHPIGSLDALALLKLVSEIRRDVKVVANEILSALKPLHNLLLPVNNMGGPTPKENLKNIHQHLEGEGAVIIFPAGEVSRLSLSGVKDGQWKKGFLRMARATHSPVLPMFVDARNSLIFYLTSMCYKPMATFLLVKEMIKQRQKTVTIKSGDMIPIEQFRRSDFDDKVLIKLFKKHLYGVAKNSSLIFKTQTSVAHPESPVAIKSELDTHKILGKTPDNKLIYLCDQLNDSAILREIGRLRELSFRTVGEGSGNNRDLDAYDHHYSHLVLWDNDDMQISGAYRFCDTHQIIQQQGMEGLYTQSLFEFNDAMKPYLSSALELGRSFVQPRYWGKRSLDYLWFGIGAYLKEHRDIRYLYGPVSISADIPSSAKDLMIYFYQLYFSIDKNIAVSKRPYIIGERESASELFKGNDYKSDFTILKRILANMGVSIPTLYKQYTELCEPGGVHFLDFGVDPDFSACVDGLVMVDLTLLKEKKRKRYIENN